MNNERLAEVWQNDVPQVVVVWPLVWKHPPGGDWFVSHKFQCPKAGTAT